MADNEEGCIKGKISVFRMMISFKYQGPMLSRMNGSQPASADTCSKLIFSLPGSTKYTGILERTDRRKQSLAMRAILLADSTLKKD